VAAPFAAALPARAEVYTSLSSDAWTPICNNEYSGYSYWTAPPDQPYARDMMRVGMGYNDIQGFPAWRSFFRIPLARAAGLTVTRVSLTLNWAKAGSFPSTVQLYQAADIDPAVRVTWDNTSGNWTTLLDQRGADGSSAVQFGGDALATAVQAAITRGARDISFGLRNTNESNRAYRKAFNPAQISLVIASP